jgi:putative ABC transport system permease protein
VQIVGVVRDVQYSSLFSDPVPFVYLPWPQNYSPTLTVVVRTRGTSAASGIRSLAASLNPNLGPLSVRSLEEVIAVGLFPQRLVAIVAGSFGLVGVWLAALGVYGVTAYTIARRTREIAIRSALGASRLAIVVLTLKHAMSLAGAGSLVGLVLAAIVGQILSSLLLGVSPIDPITVLGATMLCALVVLAACYVPVHRAVHIAAADALRAE